MSVAVDQINSKDSVSKVLRCQFGTATVTRILAEKVNDGAAPQDQVSGNQLRNRVQYGEGKVKCGNSADRPTEPEPPVSNAYEPAKMWWRLRSQFASSKGVVNRYPPLLSSRTMPKAEDKANRLHFESVEYCDLKSSYCLCDSRVGAQIAMTYIRNTILEEEHFTRITA